MGAWPLPRSRVRGAVAATRADARNQRKWAMPLEPPTLPFDLPTSHAGGATGDALRGQFSTGLDTRVREPSWCHALGRSSGVRAHSPVPSRKPEWWR